MELVQLLGDCRVIQHDSSMQGTLLAVAFASFVRILALPLTQAVLKKHTVLPCDRFWNTCRKMFIRLKRDDPMPETPKPFYLVGI